jgi:hypothetical protein
VSVTPATFKAQVQHYLQPDSFHSDQLGARALLTEWILDAEFSGRYIRGSSLHLYSGLPSLY